MSLLRKILLACFLLSTLTGTAFAANGFVVQKIQFQGLHRISESTVRSYLPISVGETLEPGETGTVINSLYATGFFSNVKLARQGNTLLVQVVERATIGRITIKGNSILKTKQLMQVLKDAGMSEGEVFNRSNFNAITQSIKQEYYNLGRYNADVTASVTPQVRDRVAVLIKINEGDVAKVKGIKVIGNKVFSEKTLIKQFKLTTPHLWTIFTKTDQYSRQKLDADLERLRSYYMDRGYLKFNIDSTQVSITPNRKSIYITVHVVEGPQYRISGYRLQGNLIGRKAELEKLVEIKAGDVFSRTKITKTDTAIGNALGNHGYAFANVNVVPQVNGAKRTVFVIFNVQPGRRIYVTQINFLGNTKTADYVMRREMRLQEGSLYSLQKVQESKRRIANLGYLTNVNINTKRVPGKPNHVDLTYHVKESSSATASLQAGYSDAYGFLYGANVTEHNFRGTGKSVSLGFNNSEYMRSYNFSYVNPYYTRSGISRAFNLYMTKVTPGSVNLTTYTTNTYGLGVNYGIPMSEYDKIFIGAAYEHIRVDIGSAPAATVKQFVVDQGDIYDVTTLSASWLHSDYDRAIFPTRGFKQSFGVQVGVPVFSRNLEYYKVNYDASYYHPVYKGFIFHAAMQLGYGNGYGKTGVLPFFNNYFAGGIGTVRGFEPNTLGPKDTAGDAVGGNILSVGTLGMVIPNPFYDRVRATVFVDAGNVYQNNLNLADLRYSAGIGVVWWSPMGPLQFSIAKPFNTGKGDDTKWFNFTIGTSF